MKSSTVEQDVLGGGGGGLQGQLAVLDQAHGKARECIDLPKWRWANEASWDFPVPVWPARWTARSASPEGRPEDRAE